MKRLVLIFLLFTSSVNGKEDSSKAINNFYIELSVGFGIFRSGEGKYLGDSFLSDRNHFTFIQTNKVGKLPRVGLELGIGRGKKGKE
jgi:hypothetical protein